MSFTRSILSEHSILNPEDYVARGSINTVVTEEGTFIGMKAPIDNMSWGSVCIHSFTHGGPKHFHPQLFLGDSIIGNESNLIRIGMNDNYPIINNELFIFITCTIDIEPIRILVEWIAADTE